jgi:hypothetical protein
MSLSDVGSDSSATPITAAENTQRMKRMLRSDVWILAGIDLMGCKPSSMLEAYWARILFGFTSASISRTANPWKSNGLSRAGDRSARRFCDVTQKIPERLIDMS